ncbi:putative exported protein precursor, partial [Yersinia pestis biovar Orientalis str. India 195]
MKAKLLITSGKLLVTSGTAACLGIMAALMPAD